MTETETLITIRDLTKSFGKTRALDSVSTEINRGHIVGLIGANGCGKSTLIRNMIGLYLPDTGKCTTFNCPAEKLGPKELSHIGYVHQEGQLLDWMTVAQHISYVKAYYDTWNEEIEAKYIEDFDIDTSSRVGKLSPGQRQKLAILLAIGFEPDLLILDEPASGLDPIARSKFLDLLLEIIQKEGKTILISSHILSDIEKIIDHTIIMEKGHIIKDCSFDELREEFCQLTISGYSDDINNIIPQENIVEITKNTTQAIITCHGLSQQQIQLLTGNTDYRWPEHVEVGRS